MGYASVILEAVIMGLITGWLFFKPDTSLVGIRSREAALYTSSSLQCYLFLLFETYRLCQLDLKVYDRERAEGCISITGFIMARRISKLIIEDVAVPLIFSIITYFMYGLRTDSAVYFWKYFAACFIFHLNTLSVGLFAAALSRDVSIATLVANLNFTFQSMLNGFFINTKQMPVYVRWCKYIAYLWYSFGFIASNEFTGFKGDCFKQYADDPNVDSICYAYTGKYILHSLGFWENWNALPICVVLAFCLGTHVAAGLVLKLNPVDVTMGKEIKSKHEIDNKIQYEDSLYNQGHGKGMEEHAVNVTIKNIGLSVVNKIKKSNKEILINVDATFEAGKLNIIMGPSGSGKTSLLNLISGRLSSTLTTKYTSSGHIYLNNFEIEDYHIVRPICSYVIQDDDHLLPTLTVKETLSFAAKLRLSKDKLSKKQRENLVDSIILQMGLKECADTLVGNELLKGISGGEKRRLSIAIQLISSPKILILDEPTSGLDSFTADSIIDCLERLSNRGTTIIMTIHQPRSLDRFGSILLLAKGGKVAFNGTKQQLIQNFQEMGFTIPVLTNLADYFIDMISYNTSNNAIEVETRQRVDSIVEHWANTKPEYHVEDSIQLTKKDQLRKEFHSYIKEPANFLAGFIVLTHRHWIGLVRDLNILAARCAQVIGMGVILALFFARFKHNVTSVQDRLGCIQQIVSLYFTGMLNNMASYPRERDYFYDEYNDDVVSINSFFFSYLVIEVPFEIFTSVVFGVLLVFVIGFQYDAGLFFAMTYCSFLTVNAGESLGISFNTVLDHPGFALTMISIFCSIGTCMAGLLAMTLDNFLKAMNYTSPLHYTVMIVSNLVFTNDLKLYCTNSERLENGSCLFTTGKDVLDAYNLKVNLKLYLCLIALIAVLHRAISYLFLVLKQAKINPTKFKKLA
ncbi:unnamed protein product [Ambrosiozyma monospora]|uniref:Unnamed protein product n=1 Tax=Ambrosiozyma monospora TaxID=43982 RepID=A0ACB5SSE3_AMBMO|nr:unnamed protein product [Ambrosiozyma monospora]